jgi:hypothetical protein
VTFVAPAAMMDAMPSFSRTAVVLVAAVSLAACASGEGSTATTGGPPTARTDMVAVVATTDLAVGSQRVSVGLPLDDQRNVSFGTVELSFSYLGTAEEPSTPQPTGVTYEARYIPTPGTPDAPEDGGGARVTSPSEARGIYQSNDVSFDRAGFWQVEVVADLEGTGTQRATSAFEVLEEPALPAPGDEALPTRNLTLGAKGVPDEAIDSRAVTEGEIPDPELHRWTIAEALRQHVPIVVIFATPVYCVSRFCGPVTEAVEELAARYEDRAAFIHIEIWRDFNAQPQVVNQAAADWLYRNDDLTEPWLYTIGTDGIIVDRWASVFDTAEVAAWLDDLPPLP